MEDTSKVMSKYVLSWAKHRAVEVTLSYVGKPERQ